MSAARPSSARRWCRRSFYGIFSAWVLWARQDAAAHGRVRLAGIAVLASARPGAARSLPADLRPRPPAPPRPRRGAGLDRGGARPCGPGTPSSRASTRAEAVTYFYEPFLEAFDPDLRKQLGVWYTPAEVVRYMVARVDRALKDDLGIADGLAADNVYVLDPCCGTGAYLAETLRRIAANLARPRPRRSHRRRGEARRHRARLRLRDHARALRRRQPASRSHYAGPRRAPGGRRAPSAPASSSPTPSPAGSPRSPRKQQRSSFPELEEERDRAEERQAGEAPVLVILGNPPYNGFAGMAVGDEWKLLEAYRKPKQVETWRC